MITGRLLNAARGLLADRLGRPEAPGLLAEERAPLEVRVDSRPGRSFIERLPTLLPRLGGVYVPVTPGWFD